MGVLNERFSRYNYSNNLKESKTKMLKIVLDKVKYCFLENKTGVIIKKNEGDNSPERFVKNYFKKKGYNVIRGKRLKTSSIKHKISLCLFPILIYMV